MTATRDMEFFLSNPDEFAGLSNDDKALVYAGGTLQGDTEAAPAKADASTESSEPPAAATEPAAENANAAGDGNNDQEPVVLTKDGKHTIPFEELAAARERATQLERENAALLERLQQPAQPSAETPPKQPDTPAPEAPAAVDIDALEAEIFEATLEGDKERALELRRQVNAELVRQAEARVLERENVAQAQADAQQSIAAVVEKAYQDYPFLDHNAEGKNPEAIRDVREWRDYLINQGTAPHEALAQAVAKFGPLYAASVSQPAPQQEQSPNAAQKAADAAIAAAKNKVPNSLSDIPAGTAAHHDEAGAMLQMGGADLMAKFAGKTPEQIEALMAKVL